MYRQTCLVLILHSWNTCSQSQRQRPTRRKLRHQEGNPSYDLAPRLELWFCGSISIPTWMTHDPDHDSWYYGSWWTQWTIMANTCEQTSWQVFSLFAVVFPGLLQLSVHKWTVDCWPFMAHGPFFRLTYIPPLPVSPDRQKKPLQRCRAAAPFVPKQQGFPELSWTWQH